jgi:poly(A) polymerase
MDPIEIIELCRDAAQNHTTPSVSYVPRLFSVGDYEALWSRNHKQVRKILDELLCAAHPGYGLDLMLRFGALEGLIPELVAIKGMGDAKGLHKDVWEHTKAVVDGVPNQLELRWGALFHDIGKARTRKFVSGRVTFHNHDVVGACMVDSIQSRLNLFGDDAVLLHTVRNLVLRHLRPAGYKQSWSDSAVRRLITECGDEDFFSKLMLLSRADLTTKRLNIREKAVARADALEKHVAKILKVDTAPKLPKFTMGIILERSGKKPGRWLSIVKNQLDAQLANGTLPGEMDAEFYASVGLKLFELGNFS